jgi:hypothetical protein
MLKNLQVFAEFISFLTKIQENPDLYLQFQKPLELVAYFKLLLRLPTTMAFLVRDGSALKWKACPVC